MRISRVDFTLKPKALFKTAQVVVRFTTSLSLMPTTANGVPPLISTLNLRAVPRSVAAMGIIVQPQHMSTTSPPSSPPSSSSLSSSSRLLGATSSSPLIFLSPLSAFPLPASFVFSLLDIEKLPMIDLAVAFISLFFFVKFTKLCPAPTLTPLLSATVSFVLSSAFCFVAFRFRFKPFSVILKFLLFTLNETISSTKRKSCSMGLDIDVGST
mmetsp:Transcript_15233/g.20943  ORF Transcript_15233/g.20943 Transcript_15233/m.20943 type:complete len:212 (+) Transcript_15233:1361-1996(+)